MLIELADWQLEVDIPLTMALSVGQTHDHCTCGYCRNYYAAIDSAYPAIRPFLSRFGVDVEGPDELCPFEPTIYEATYIVQGYILRKGSHNLTVANIPLEICSSEDSDICTEHPKPYFTLCIGLMELPWLLAEPMDDVVSPANEEEFLHRMQQKLLLRLGTEQLNS